MGKIVEKLTRKLGRAPTSEEIEEAKRKAAQKKEAARAQAAAQPAEAGGSSSALVPAAAAASAGKRAADDAGAPAAAKRPRGRPKKGSHGPSESPEFSESAPCPSLIPTPSAPWRRADSSHRALDSCRAAGYGRED